MSTFSVSMHCAANHSNNAKCLLVIVAQMEPFIFVRIAEIIRFLKPFYGNKSNNESHFLIHCTVVAFKKIWHAARSRCFPQHC